MTSTSSINFALIPRDQTKHLPSALLPSNLFLSRHRNLARCCLLDLRLRLRCEVSLSFCSPKPKQADLMFPESFWQWTQLISGNIYSPAFSFINSISINCCDLLLIFKASVDCYTHECARKPGYATIDEYHRKDEKGGTFAKSGGKERCYAICFVCSAHPRAFQPQ